MKITCEEASSICDKSQYKEATFWDIVKLRIHLLYCKTCKAYSKKNNGLTSMCERAGLTVLSKDEKERMKRDLEKKL